MTRRLHICALIQYFEVGGIERLVLELATECARAGIRTSVVAYVQDGPFRSVLDDAGVHTAFLGAGGGLLGAGGGGLRPAVALRLAAWLRRERVDVLHSHHLGPFLYGAAAARLTGTPHLHTEHSRELYDTTRRQLLGRLMPHLAHVVTVSDELSRWRAQHFDDRCEVIQNGVFVPPTPNAAQRRAARTGLGLGDDAFAVGCVARMGAEKDHATLLKAFDILHARRPEAQLILVGDGPERGRLERGAPPSVRFLGVRNDVGELLPAFDVLALSSLREGLPLALLEGMARGLPVVATAVGAIPELLGAGGGQVVPVASPAQLAAALDRYTDPRVRQRDGEAARALVLERFDQGAMVARYAELYRTLAGHPGAGPPPRGAPPTGAGVSH